MWKRIGAAAAAVALAVLLPFVLAPRVAVSRGIAIAAPPAKVWTVLTDLAGYRRWNTAMRLHGSLKQGAVIENIEDPGPDQIVFWPTVLVLVPDQELMWRGHLLLWRRLWIPRLLDADHRFILRPAPGGGTAFTQEETFRGVLLWLWNPASVLPDFDAMNRALKARAEAR